jgi:O-antigen ligase
MDSRKMNALSPSLPAAKNLPTKSYLLPGGIAIVLAVCALMMRVPFEVVAIPVFLVFLWIGFKNPLYVVYFVIVTNIDVVQSEFTYQGLTIFQFYAAVLIIVFFARRLIVKRSNPKAHYGIFGILTLMTMAFALLPLLRIGEYEWELFIGNSLRLMIVWVLVIESRNAGHIEMIVSALKCLGIVTALGVILSYIAPDLVLWQNSSLYQHNQYLRILGFERDPNYAALKMLMILPFFLVALSGVHVFAKSAIKIAPVFLISLAILLTGSRASLFIIAGIILVWFAWFVRKKRGQWRYRALALILIVLVVSIGRPFWESTMDRFYIHGRSIEGIYSAEYDLRWFMVTEGLNQFRKSPVIGTGFSGEGYHNTFADILAGYGLFGFIPFVGLLLAVARHQFSRAFGQSGSTNAARIYIASGLGLGAWSLMGLTLGAEREIVFWIIFGVSLSMMRIDGGKIALSTFTKTKSGRVSPLNSRPSPETGKMPKGNSAG